MENNFSMDGGGGWFGFHLPPHLLLCALVPNRAWTGTSSWPKVGNPDLKIVFGPRNVVKSQCKLQTVGGCPGSRMRWLDGITYSIDMNLSKLHEIVEDRGAWRAAVPGVKKSEHD